VALIRTMSYLMGNTEARSFRFNELIATSAANLSELPTGQADETGMADAGFLPFAAYSSFMKVAGAATSPCNAWISISCGCGMSGLGLQHEFASPKIDNDCDTKRWRSSGFLCPAGAADDERLVAPPPIRKRVGYPTYLSGC